MMPDVFNLPRNQHEGEPDALTPDTLPLDKVRAREDDADAMARAAKVRPDRVDREEALAGSKRPDEPGGEERASRP